MRWKTGPWFLFLGLMLLAASPASPALPVLQAQAAQAADISTSSSAAQTIERFNQTLLSAMRGGEELGYQGRYELLRAVIDDIFADRFMARFAAGRFWRDMSNEQKREYLRAYLDWTVSAYAERFDRYNGQRFDIGQVEARDDQASVDSTLTKANGETVDFTYKLRAQNGRWLIVDIIVRDVSQLAMTRSQFTSILEREGFDALMTRLEQKMEVYSEDLSG